MGCCNQPKPLMPIGVNPPAYPGPACSTPCTPWAPVPPVPPKPTQCNLPCDQTVFRRVLIPSTMGDDTTLPPSSLEYRNVILEYEFNGHVYIFSSDGVPTLISNGTGTNFNDLTNRPMYNGEAMTGLTNIPQVPTAISDLSDAARITCIESTNQALKQSYQTLNTGLVNLTQTVDTQGDTLIALQNNIDTLDCKKQDKLIGEGVGQNIKTVNGFNLLGEGNVEITLDSAGVQPLLVSGENIKTINGESILGEGNLEINLPPSYELPRNIAGKVSEEARSNLFTRIDETLYGSISIHLASIDIATQETYESSFELHPATKYASGLMTKNDRVKLDNLDPTKIDALGNRLDTAENTITELQNYADKTVQTDTKLGSDLTSTVTLIKTVDSLASSQPTDTEIPLPVASATQAGVMNSEMYNQLQDNTLKIQTIIGNSTSIPALPENPTNEQITDAYKTATGQTEVPNGAKVTDPSGKTYVYNATTQKWELFSDGGAVEVSPFTNDIAGTILGNDVDGGVVSDGGKGLVKGWDIVKADIANNSTALTTAQGDITALQGRMTTAETNITTVATKADTNATALATTNANLTTLEGRVDTNANDITTINGDIISLTNRVSTVETTASGTATDLSALTARVTTAEAAISANTAAIEANTALIGDVDALLTKLDTGAGVD